MLHDVRDKGSWKMLKEREARTRWWKLVRMNMFVKMETLVRMEKLVKMKTLVNEDRGVGEDRRWRREVLFGAGVPDHARPLEYY